MMAVTFDGTGTRASAAPPRVAFEGGFLPYNAIRRRPSTTSFRTVDSWLCSVCDPVVPNSIVVVLNALQGLASQSSR